jgi:hypothetical protein
MTALRTDVWPYRIPGVLGGRWFADPHNQGLQITLSRRDTV